MQRNRLIAALTGLVGSDLAEDITDHFLKIRQDVATQTLERASPGKFVETFVQCIQYISRGSYDAKPSVDNYLNMRCENDTGLPDGLRFSACRIARSMYTMRNKRNIAHNGEVDPNRYDLAYLHHAASWIMAELMRSASGVPMAEAGKMIELLQTPAGTLVEEIDGVRLVHADVSTRIELLILLHSHYPEYVPIDSIKSTLSRRSASSIRGRIGDLKGEKLVFGDNATGYRLTTAGHTTAMQEISKIQES
ncbi:hypothetical protein [Mameliella alba]|uniref:hypothetical protein n=1 Tax=Mameliella alba TaxID=561184 RepID=UPI0014309782|nr:hypothetical protein [Mameliella alba]